MARIRVCDLCGDKIDNADETLVPRKMEFERPASAIDSLESDETLKIEIGTTRLRKTEHSRETWPKVDVCDDCLLEALKHAK